MSLIQIVTTLIVLFLIVVVALTILGAIFIGVLDSRTRQAKEKRALEQQADGYFDDNEGALLFLKSQAEWWCQRCQTFQSRAVIEIKYLPDSDWDEGKSYLACPKCGSKVIRAPLVKPQDLREWDWQDVLIDFAAGTEWREVRPNFTSPQLDGFYFAFNEWKAERMSPDEAIEFEEVLKSKEVTRLMSFLWRQRYIPTSSSSNSASR